MLRALPVALLLSACGPGAIAVDSADGTTPSACSAGLWGEAFRSLEDQECGVGPDGPVMCRWALTFGEETYDWTYSDVAESGTVTCADNALTGTSSGGVAREGTYHRPTARVRWEGVSYEPASK